MNALDTLGKEHRLLERVLSALEIYAHGLSCGNGDPQLLQTFTEFFTDFAEGMHHVREERILFPALIACGLPERHGPVAQLRLEHATGRRFLRTLQELSARHSRWSEADRRDVVETCRAYVHLMRSHIAQEERVLLPYVFARLLPPEREGLDRQFEEFERRTESSKRDRYAQADDLIFGASRISETSTSHACEP